MLCKLMYIFFSQFCVVPRFFLPDWQMKDPIWLLSLDVTNIRGGKINCPYCPTACRANEIILRIQVKNASGKNRQVSCFLLTLTVLNFLNGIIHLSFLKLPIIIFKDVKIKTWKLVSQQNRFWSDNMDV